ncbi:hypothetical protein [Paenibacillus sp. OAS669]|nr:hypothetical protein [Paenibacillus sp. OAS669]MBE1442668.1 hypothetical protein [Paenibacillus sp. OAS669]
MKLGRLGLTAGLVLSVMMAGCEFRQLSRDGRRKVLQYGKTAW